MPTPAFAAPSGRHGPPRISAVLVAGSALLVLSACSSGSDDTPAPAAGPSSATSTGGATPGATATAPALVAKPGTIVGALPAAQRTQAVAAIGKVVDGWVSAAYVGGDYPRTDFANAYPGFTKGAAASARRDPLLSNRQEGGSIESVTVQRTVAKVDLVADRKSPIGATARVRLLFTTTGAYARQVRVIGRLFLTPSAGDTWQVFGYQIRKAEL